MKNKIGIGIIGTGNIAQNGHRYAASCIDEVEIVSVLSRNKTKGNKFLAESEFRGVVYERIEDFVKDEKTQLVIIASPDCFHYQQAKESLNAGKHVLVEKPMTLEISEAEELKKIAKEKNLTLAVGFHLRSHNGHIELKKILKKKNDRLRHIRIIWAWPVSSDTNWRSKSDFTKWWSLSAVGSHCIDLARFFAEDFDDWLSVKATLTNSVFKGKHDETAIVSGQFRSGATFEIVSSVLFGPYNRIEIFWGSTFAVCEDTLGREGAGIITVNGENIKYKNKNPFIIQLENVLAKINENLTLNAPPEAGLRSVKDLSRIISL